MGSRRITRIAWSSAALIGAAAGLLVLGQKLATDPFADVRAYYDAAARLNVGAPLYPLAQDVNGPTAYFYPPLFAILFRPVALLPFEVAVAIWEAIVILAFVATVYLLGARRRQVWIAIGVLGLPIAWALAAAQAHSVVTLLVTTATPFGIALAANIKLFPILAGVWYLGRRNWRRVGMLVFWLTTLGLFQLVLEPTATLDYVRLVGLGWVGEVRSFSPYAISPILWAILLVAGVILALRLAPSRWGWPAAVALSTLAPPRLLSYMLIEFLAALRDPPAAGSAAGPVGGPPTVAQFRDSQPPVD